MRIAVRRGASTRRRHSAAVTFIVMTLIATAARAEQPPPPCHANPQAAQDRATVSQRGDIVNLPAPLKNRLVQLADRPHSQLPTQAYSEADKRSRLFQYYLLDTSSFEPNVFTTIFPGINDQVELTVTGSTCGLPTVGAVRVVVEPKPDEPADPTNPHAFIDLFTDISPLLVINNEAGWYESWMIHDLVVAKVNPSPRSDGHAQFGALLPPDAALLAKMGSGNNAPGNTFTQDGNAPHAPSAFDHFPDAQTNLVPLYVSVGTFNSLQQADTHPYWEFNYQGTNYVHPLYELPFTGGFPDNFGEPPDAFTDGEIGKRQSIVPGSGPSGVTNNPAIFGDDPNLPRDPDKFDGDADVQREVRYRNIPSGLANEIFLDVYERPASFEPKVKNLQQRLFDAYAAEVARVDQNGDGVLSAVETDIDNGSDGFADNFRLFVPATEFNRFAVTREINDGLIAPRFSPSTRAFVLSGVRVPVNPFVEASTGRDADDR